MRRIWRGVKIAALALACVLFVLIGATLGYRAYRHHEINEMTAVGAAGIDEASFVHIGGIEQWVSIRGRDRRNPALLIVHGGPGFALSILPRTALFDWTKDFTVSQWDQRGAGKTFGRSGPVGADITIERMARDGIEVAQLVRSRVNQQKIILVGVSWGASLGVMMATMRPDLFYAYTTMSHLSRQ